MLLIDNETVHKTLDMPTCIEVQEKAFLGLANGESALRPRIDLYAPCDDPESYYRWGSAEGAWGGYFAARVKSDIMSWVRDENGNAINERKHCVRPGLYCGLVYLFSTRNGEPLAILNDGVIQHMRVGGGAGIGAKHLAREDSHVLAMIGAGGMAETYLEAIKCVRDIQEIRVFARTPQNRERFAAEMGEKLGVSIKPVASAREAVKGADIVSCCTDSLLPVFEADWLEPGMHVVNVNHREVPEDAFPRFDIAIQQGIESLHMDIDRDGFRSDIGTGVGGYFAGTQEQLSHIPNKSHGGKKGHNFPHFKELAAGKADGRTSRDQITYYHNMGNNGLQFASCAGIVYERCKEQGLGHELPTEWFTQDIRN